MQNVENRTNELDHAAVGGVTMSSALPTLMEDDAFHRAHSEPVLQPRRGSDVDTGVSSNGLSRTGSTTSTRSSSPAASLASQPLTLIDKIQVRCRACEFYRTVPTSTILVTSDDSCLFCTTLNFIRLR